MRAFLLSILAVSALLAAGLAGCTSAPSAVAGESGGSVDANGGALLDSAGAGGAPSPTGVGGTGNELNVTPQGEAGATPPADLTNLALQVAVDQDQVTVAGSPVSVAAHAQYDDGSLPQSVVWSVDNARVGSLPVWRTHAERSAHGRSEWSTCSR